MNAQGLLPFQIEPAQQLLTALRINGSALDASSCGIGKSYHAAAIIRELAEPALVVCPKISITAWKNVLETMGAQAGVTNWEALRGGNTAFGRWDHPAPKKRPSKMICTNCDNEVDVFNPSPCRVSPDNKHAVSPVAIPHVYGRFVFNDTLRFVVWDEAHAAAGLKSLNSDMVIASKRQHLKSLFLSATICDSPLQLRSVGFALGLHCLVGPAGFFAWAARRGCRRVFGRGFQFAASDSQKIKIMGGIHESLFPAKGIRVNSADIPDFPRCQITSELFDLEASGKLTELYKTMEDAIEELNRVKLTDKNAEHPLTALLRSSMQIELLKLPIFLALRQDALDEGKSVVFFVQYRQSLEELQRRTKAPTIYGGQRPDERQKAIDDFQAEKTDTIILNIAAGGVSISLHHIAPGVRPRVGICSLHPSATKSRQMFGRLARAGGLSPARYRIPLCANTPEERLHKRLSSKLNCLDALLDSDLTACNLPLTSGDLSSLLEE